MEEEYWKRFFKTGDIKDYLYYKGMAICRQVMENYAQGACRHVCPDGTGGQPKLSNQE